MPTKCGNCGIDGATKVCSRCRGVSYCSKECQKVHWKAGHKRNCKKGKKKAAAAKTFQKMLGGPKTNFTPLMSKRMDAFMKREEQKKLSAASAVLKDASMATASASATAATMPVSKKTSATTSASAAELEHVASTVRRFMLLQSVHVSEALNLFSSSIGKIFGGEELSRLGERSSETIDALSSDANTDKPTPLVLLLRLLSKSLHSSCMPANVSVSMIRTCVKKGIGMESLLSDKIIVDWLNATAPEVAAEAVWKLLRFLHLSYSGTWREAKDGVQLLLLCSHSGNTRTMSEDGSNDDSTQRQSLVLLETTPWKDFNDERLAKQLSPLTSKSPEPALAATFLSAWIRNGMPPASAGAKSKAQTCVMPFSIQVCKENIFQRQMAVIPLEVNIGIDVFACENN